MGKPGLYIVEDRAYETWDLGENGHEYDWGRITL